MKPSGKKEGDATATTTTPKHSKSRERPPPEPSDCNFLDTIFPSLLTMSVFFGCTIPEWIFILPWYIRGFEMEIYLPIIIVFSLTTLTTIVNFSYASFMNPGYLPKAPDLRYLRRQPSMIKVNGMDIRLKHCRTCHYYRMPRTTHCSQCDYCVDNFDHHCPWVNNCVGRRNYRFFFAFLCCLTCHIIMSISICVVYLLYQRGNFLSSSWDPSKVIAFTVSGTAGLILVPVFGLLCFHMFLISQGLTTYEYVTKKYKEYGRSPFDMGPCRNCAFQLCGPEYPAFKPLESGNNENGSHEVQRELLAKLIENNGNKSDRENDGGYLLKKVGPIANLTDGDTNPADVDVLDKYDNPLELMSKLSDKGVNANANPEDVLPQHTDECIILHLEEEQSINNNSDVTIKEISITDHVDISIADGCGDICCQIPDEILEEEESHKDLIIQKSP